MSFFHGFLWRSRSSAFAGSFRKPVLVLLGMAVYVPAVYMGALLNDTRRRSASGPIETASPPITDSETATITTPTLHKQEIFDQIASSYDELIHTEETMMGMGWIR